MKAELQALLVEDSPSDTLLLLRELGRAGFVVEHLRVDSAEAMQSALEERAWDIILSAFSMPSFSATAALRLLQDMKLDIPFIIVSGTMGEETAVAAMKAGAHDYFAKGRLTRLAAAIDRELREAEERKCRRLAEQALVHAEKRFAQAFQINPSAICISSLEEDILLEVNPRFLQLFAYERAELIGKSLAELGLWLNSHARQEYRELLQRNDTIRDVESQVGDHLCLGEVTGKEKLRF